MYRLYSFIFVAGVATSLYSGIGVKFGFLDETIAGLYGILGLMGTGMGFAGRNYIYKKQQLDKAIRSEKKAGSR